MLIYLTVSRNEQILLAFSAVTNGRKILHCGPAPSDSLTCVHGLRFLSLAWVIMVHTYLQVFSIAGQFPKIMCFSLLQLNCILTFRKQNVEDADRKEFYVPNGEQRDIFRRYFLFHQVKKNKTITYIAIISNSTSYTFYSGLLVTYLYYKTINKKEGPEVAVSRTPKCNLSILRNDTIKFFKLLGYRFIR